MTLIEKKERAITLKMGYANSRGRTIEKKVQLTLDHELAKRKRKILGNKDLEKRKIKKDDKQITGETPLYL